MDEYERIEQIDFAHVMFRVLCRDYEHMRISNLTLADNLEYIAGELEYICGGLDETGTACSLRECSCEIRRRVHYSEVIAIINIAEWNLPVGEFCVLD